MEYPRFLRSAIVSCVVAVLAPRAAEAQPDVSFLRGDVDGDGILHVGDATLLIDVLFFGADPLRCCAATDANDDGDISVSDAIWILNFVLAGGPPPAGAFPLCDAAPSGDDCFAAGDLPCDSYPAEACAGRQLRLPKPELRLRLSSSQLFEGPPDSVIEVPVTVQLLGSDRAESVVEFWSLAVAPAPGSECSIVAVIPPEPFDPKIPITAVGGLTQGPGNEGAFCFSDLVFPAAGGPFDLCELRVRATIPPSGCRSCVLELRDGLRQGLQVHANRLVFRDRSAFPPFAQTVTPFSRPLTLDLCAAIRRLVPNGPAEVVSLTPASPTVLFRLDPMPPRRSVVSLRLGGADSADASSLYVRWAALPRSTAFDLAADRRSQASQRLVVPFAEERPCFVLVEGNVFSGGAIDATLQATVGSISLESVSTDCGESGCSGLVHAAVQGGGFDDETRFLLRRPGAADIEAVGLVLVSSERVEVALDLTGAPVGLYDLVAREPGGLEAALPAALRISSGKTGPRVEVSLRAPAFYRERRLRRMTLCYKNSGDQEVPAPLLEVEGPAGTQLAPASVRHLRDGEVPVIDCPPGGGAGAGGAEGILREGKLHVLGIAVGGVAGRLPPGASGEVPILFRHLDPFPPPNDPAFEDARLEIAVRMLAPAAGEGLAWSALSPPEGMEPAEWGLLRQRLETTHGADYIEALSNVATRLARRGVRASSVLDLFRFAVAEATGEPGAVILGVARDPGGAPLEYQRVAAFTGAPDASPAACALTDFEGAFSLGPLVDGVYRLGVEGYAVEPAEVAVSGGQDVLAVTLQAIERDLPTIFSCQESVKPGGLPLSTPGLPPAQLDAAALASLRPAESEDPNTKEGPDEDLEVGPGQEMLYTVHFANEASANAAARKVEVADELSPLLDPSTLVLREVQFGGALVVLEEAEARSRSSGYGLSRGEERQTVRALQEVCSPFPNASAPSSILVEINARLEPGTRTVRWVLEALDSLTALTELYDDRSGLLPPNNPSPIGEGDVTFTVRVRAGAMGGEIIENCARITFDDQHERAMDTNMVRHVVAGAAPSFIRGDANDDGTLDISDALFLIGDLSLGTTEVLCLDAGDSNDDGAIDISDVISIIGPLFLGFPDPKPPFPACGVEPPESADDLDCGLHTFCE
jgi:hypothetical protein